MNAPDGTMSTDMSNSLVHEIKKNLLDLPGNPMEKKKCTIFRLPAHIRQKHKELYEPGMVSIGPYYNGRDTLHSMEKHKWRYLRDYLFRNTRNSLEHCVSELRELESQARRCYFEEVKLSSDQFLMMMLLDGCFIIEFLLKWHFRVSDTIFDVDWALPMIQSDLLLLENQIPFFVIQKLFGLLTCFDPVPAEENTYTPDLVELLLQCLPNEFGAGCPSPITVLCTHTEIKHILHLYHLCYVPTPRSNELSARTYGIKRWLHPITVFVFLTSFLMLCFRRSKSTKRRFPLKLPSATELKESGVIFESKNSENFLDIKFQNGTLEIPFILVTENWKTLLLNLVSFEQCDRELDKNLTSYACFMSSIFKTARDVTVLRKKGILDNLQATNEELVLFLTWLIECSSLDYDEHYLKELFIDVKRYYNSDWHRWRATLKINYFNNPWSIISLTAAFALLALTVLQTSYTILPYYHHKN